MYFSKKYLENKVDRDSLSIIEDYYNNIVSCAICEKCIETDIKSRKCNRCNKKYCQECLNKKREQYEFACFHCPMKRKSKIFTFLPLIE